MSLQSCGIDNTVLSPIVEVLVRRAKTSGVGIDCTEPFYFGVCIEYPFHFVICIAYPFYFVVCVEDPFYFVVCNGVVIVNSVCDE